MENKIELEEGSFEYETYQMIAPVVKTFLSDYFGDKLLYLEPESYSEIENAIIKNVHYNACILPDVLYKHRTIKDADEWEKALANFKNDNAELPWPVTQHWFERDFRYDDDDDDDTFLEDAYSFELNEDQQKAKKIVDVADQIINDTRKFALFMRAGYLALNSATRQFLIDCAIFDLKILSNEGFIELQNKIDMMNEEILEEVFALI